MTRLRRFAAFAGIATAWSTTPSRAVETTFRPTLAFGAAHDGNVLIVDYNPATQQSVDKQGDEYARVNVDLAWDWKTRTSSTSFAYRPEYLKYRTRDDLDYFGNTLVLSHTRQASTRATTTITFDLVRTDTQGVTSVNVSRPNSFVPRTTLTRGHGEGGGSVTLGSRDLLDWQVRASADRYKEVANVVLQDTTTVGVLAGWRYRLSERNTLGLAIRLDGFDYTSVPSNGSTSALPSVVVHTLGSTGTYQLDRLTLVTYGIGLSHATSEGTSATNGAFLLSVARDVADVIHLDAGLRRSVSPGTGTGGATLDTGAWIGFDHPAPRRGVTGSVYGAYWRREGLDIGQHPGGTNDTGSLNGTVGWTFNRYVSLHAAYGFTYQPRTTIGVQDPATQQTTQQVVESSNYGSYGIYVRWAIRGR